MIETFLADLTKRGVRLEVEQGNLRVAGQITEDDRHALRRFKEKIVERLCGPTENVFESMKNLASFFGKDVIVDGRQMMLWGMTPRGAIVNNGLFLLTVDFEEVEPE